jgi:hypothetical protein
LGVRVPQGAPIRGAVATFTPLPRSERLLLWTTAAAALVLRAVALFRYRFDSDEQQHLHVAWGWTAGLVQYRDLFDNHAPLFHMLTAPILALLGERPDILLWMRLPMLALFAFVVWGTFALGRHLYDTRTGLWAAALLALFPPFFLKSLEYRTDNLWNAFWIAALLAVLVRRSAFLAGLFLGCALGVSLKTSLLLITFAVAGSLLWWFVLDRKPVRFPLHRFLAGFVLVPLALAIYFVSRGAWDALVFCNFTFNGNLALTRKNLWIGRAIFPFTFGALVWVAWRTRRTADPSRWFVAVACGVFTTVLAGFWILISPRDFLPLMPLAAIFAAATLVRTRRPAASLAMTVVALCIALYYYADRFENNTDWHVTMMQQALRLTHPGEPLMDVKGETIYRRRPFYYPFELITRSQMAHGIIADTVAQDVIRSRTYVAQADGPMWPPAARAWLSANFVNMGRLRAAGQWLKPDGSFTIAIPGEYVVVDENGVAPGVLDGARNGARVLASGSHMFSGKPGACVVWAPAFRRGHSPFHLRDLDF